MSRSTQKTAKSDRIPNPVKLFISFSGERGTFEYWNGESTQQLDEISFVVLDTRGSVTGWSDENNCRIFSNYFKTTKEPVTLKAGSKDSVKELFSGTYHGDKMTIESLGGKYQCNIFAMLLGEEGDVTPAGLQFNASSLGAWSEFTKTMKFGDVYNHVFTATKSNPIKKGKVVFHVPVFTTSEVPSEIETMATEFDAAYLNPYLNQSSKKEEEVVEVA